MFKKLQTTFLLLCLATYASAQTRYIAATGTDTTNDCTLPGNPCASITYAVSQANAGDTIFVASGTYNFTDAQVIDKSVIVMGQDSLLKPVITATALDVIQVTADSVSISNLRIEMGLSASNGLRGIVASGSYNGLKVENNQIFSKKALSLGMVFSSYGILAYGGIGQIITVSNNEIGPLDSTYDAHGRGVGVGLNGAPGPGANIFSNSIRAFYPIQSIENTGDLICNDNWFIGSVLISYPFAGTNTIFTANLFDAYNNQIAANLTALLEIRAFNANCSALVENNEFKNYTRVGLFSSASRNITVLGNEFSPSDSASNFISIYANTKLFTAGNQTTNYSNQIDVRGNLFHAGLDSMGAAIIFADHYGNTSPAFDDTIKVGGVNPSDKNIFDINQKYFIVLDTLSGPTTSNTFWTGYSVSNMLPFSQSVYALAAYNEYNITDTIALEEKMLDSLEISGVGKVILFDSLVVTSYKNYELLSMNVYPNPSEQFITIQNSKLSGLTQVSILNLEGKQVMNIQQNTSNNQISIPVNQLAQGQYIIILQNKNTLYQSKFIKN